MKLGNLADVPLDDVFICLDKGSENFNKVLVLKYHEEYNSVVYYPEKDDFITVPKWMRVAY